MELVGEQLRSVVEPRHVGYGIHAYSAHLFPLALVTRVIHAEPMFGAHDWMVRVLGGYVQRSCEHEVREQLPHVKLSVYSNRTLELLAQEDNVRHVAIAPAGGATDHCKRVTRTNLERTHAINVHQHTRTHTPARPTKIHGQL